MDNFLLILEKLGNHTLLKQLHDHPLCILQPHRDVLIFRSPWTKKKGYRFKLRELEAIGTVRINSGISLLHDPF